jgi:hypothetical protein
MKAGLMGSIAGWNLSMTERGGLGGERAVKLGL